MSKPDEMLELYQFEGCPYCSKVRQKMTDLGIDFIARAVDPNDRSRVEEVSGQTNVPVLVDPNTDTTMPESDDIVDHLEQHYG
ncbi:MAG: Glutaredoxin 2 [Candidatus Nanosalina sp. J07AB43]|nr:MAG: Glutaredoxin 2 [Candidatus Nanosalina sp. J07AB43]